MSHAVRVTCRMTMRLRVLCALSMGLVSCSALPPTSALCSDEVVDPARPIPSIACAAENENAATCPSGLVGHGYRCVAAQCWRSFEGAPCLPVDGGVTESDAGFCASGETCTTEGALDCARVRSCASGCWAPTDATRCRSDAGAGGSLCTSTSFPEGPSFVCTSAFAGSWVCPGGPTGGYGYECKPEACWQAWFDGPCVTPPDAGPGPDAGIVLCGAFSGTAPGAPCSASNVGEIWCVGSARFQCLPEPELCWSNNRGTQVCTHVSP